jgi:hypothetical protein
MRRLIKVGFVILLCLIVASAASAQIDVELAFDPEVAYPGDTVTMFAGISNLGDEDVLATIELMINVNDMDFGPFVGELPLAAGEECSREFAFYVPPVPMDVTMTITVTATAGDYSDTATATLTILAQEGDDSQSGSIDDLGQELLDGITGAAAPSNSKSMGQIKNQYR